MTLSLKKTLHDVTSSKDNKLYFINKEKYPSNLSGNLDGYVSFAQSHTIPPKNNDQQELPRLVSNREALLMLTLPTYHKDDDIISAKIIDNNGNTLGNVELRPPSDLPRSDRPDYVDNNHPDVVYAENTWSAVIPWNMVQPNITIEFTNNQNQFGVLDDINVGAENEIVIQNIRIGMLTKPLPIHKFEQDPLLAADYFQKIPISSMKVGNYAPLYLKEIVLPDGTRYTESSASKGGVYSGDMREKIAKSLISMGIDNANFGINNTAGSVQWQPQYFNQYVVHKAIGRYKNGDIQHGLSGGNGMATLINTVGNEFSHELGHAYGMGHYPGGGRLSTHNENSGWGWDSFHNQFIANFFWNQSGATVIGGEATQPFKNLYRFNTDAMAGGVSSSAISKYTHHTGYTAKRIQHNFEKTGYLTAEGYKKWNENTNEMEIVKKGKVPEIYGTDVVTLVGYYDPQMEKSSYIYPAMFGSFGHTFAQDKPTAIQCWIDVHMTDGTIKQFPLSGERLNSNEMNKFHINVARSDDPEYASIFCPKDNPLSNYKSWLLSKFGVKDFHKWSDSGRGNVGDVYEYNRPYGDTEYFLLTSASYWYFPDTSRSNNHWKFLGYGKDFHREFLNSFESVPFDPDKAIELNQRAIEFQIEPQPAIMIGKEYGYDQARTIAVNKSSTFDEIDDVLKSKDFGSINDFISFITSYYKNTDISYWNGNRKGIIGNIYHYPNPYTGKNEFFVLKTKDYGYYPTDQTSNNQWKYLGFADKYIANTLSPFDIDKNITFEENLAKKFNASKNALNWGQRFDFRKIGLVFKYDNPYNGDREYFKQLRPKHGWYFPTSKVTNRDWIYMGDDKQFELRKKKLRTLDGFRADIKEWYKQDVIFNWGDKADVGSIFEYRFHDGGIYYFKLTNPTYGYFPWPKNGVGYDHGSWKYMGKFDNR
ncbi:M66 family metalloprotease [Photobacterium damselae subsp. damselae]|uniref:M66 family metalloprotease n=2 Tax=Photobacterium damselae TaxID=38293 RepID=UPI001F2C5767|nr:M66 family metalloprotease [Photobacterium damselae]UKA22889.1 M66 family metalloprotease [Photobacterium damselae subsp. damselae]